MTALDEKLIQIAETFAKLETIPLEAGARLMNLLDRAPDEALQMLVDRKVKFCWMPAQRRLNQRKAAAKLEAAVMEILES